MEDDPLTLRVISETLGSVLVDRDEATASQSGPWDLSVRNKEPHLFDLTAWLDSLPQAALLSGRETHRRRTTRPGRTANESHPRTSTVRSKEGVISHSADRLARAIVLATNSPSDPRTLTAWGQQAGASRGALRVWCKSAGVSARSCLDFLRVLRAVILSSHQPWDLLSLLDVVDQRSLLKLLDRGGVRELCREAPPTVDDYLLRQRFLDNQQILQAVARRLKASLEP